VFNGVIWRGFVSFSDKTYSAANDGTASGAVQPQSPERSGSSAPLVSWQSLGKQGRGFVGRGNTQAELSSFNGEPAKEPIRIYVGLDSATSDQAQADLAVKGLDQAERDYALLTEAVKQGKVKVKTGRLRARAIVRRTATSVRGEGSRVVH